MNEIINFEGMSNDQLQIIQQQILSKQLSNIQNELESMKLQLNKQETKSKLQNDEISGVREDVAEIKDALHILAVEPAKLNELRMAISRKVVTLTKGMKTNEYTLFSKMLFAKLGAHLKKSLNVPRYDSIRIDDFDTALTIVKRWTPTQKDYKDKLKEYINCEVDMSPGKLKALHRFLEKNGGNF